MSKITPKKNKSIFTDEVLSLLPSNTSRKRGVSNKIKGDDPEYQEKIRKTVKEQWETNDQTSRKKNMSLGTMKKWEDPVYIEKMKEGREKSGQYTDPVKAANFKSPIIGTCKKTGKEIVFLGAKQLKDSGFEPGNVYSCLTGKRKSTGGYTWKRA
jgi:hypothetical protein